MATYEVVQEWYLQEQGIALEVGMRFQDGDLDPDVIAQLTSNGVIIELVGPEPESDEPTE
jgi:hypothetical protein